MNLPKRAHGAVHDEPCLCAKYEPGRILIDDYWHGICLNCGSLRGKATGEGATISAEKLRKLNRARRTELEK